MKDTLFPFQEKALGDLHTAPTGAGKTIMITQLFEELLYGDADHIGDPDSIFIWLSDSPELNEQTRMKIETKSDKIPAMNQINARLLFGLLSRIPPMNTSENSIALLMKPIVAPTLRRERQTRLNPSCRSS